MRTIANTSDIIIITTTTTTNNHDNNNDNNDDNNDDNKRNDTDDKQPGAGAGFIKGGGVQWKQGVMIYMMLYASLSYNFTPIHCTRFPLHPSVMNTQALPSMHP